MRAQLKLLPKIIYEDHELLVLDKPAGMPSHANANSATTETAVDFALRHAGALPENPGQPLQNGLCHRLDSGTSGILIFAKTPELLRFSRENWQIFAEQKIYRARVEAADFFTGKFPTEIHFPLGHSKKSAKRMIAIRHDGHRAQIRGKALECRTEILKHESIGPKEFLLTLALHGGVMHQIRAHLAEVGLPIVGDVVYGTKTQTSRLMLHHARMTLKPKRELTLTIESQLPPEFSSR